MEQLTKSYKVIMRNKMLDQVLKGGRTVTVSHLWLAVIWVLGFVVGIMIG